MIEFKRYAHIKDLLLHYAKLDNDSSTIDILSQGVCRKDSAEKLSLFVWRVVDAIHDDNEKGVEVMGSTDNLEMLPDLEYEISDYMRKVGFYEAWRSVSEKA